MLLIWWCCVVKFKLWFLCTIFCWGFNAGGGVHDVEWTEEHLLAIVEFCCCTGTIKFSLLLSTVEELCLFWDKFKDVELLFGDTGSKQLAFDELLFDCDGVDGDIGNVTTDSIILLLLVLLLLLLLVDGIWDWLTERCWCCNCIGVCWCCCCCCCDRWFDDKNGVSQIDDSACELADNDENCETLNGKCWEGHCKSEWISDVCNRFISLKKIIAY